MEIKEIESKIRFNGYRILSAEAYLQRVPPESDEFYRTISLIETTMEEQQILAVHLINAKIESRQEKEQL